MKALIFTDIWHEKVTHHPPMDSYPLNLLVCQMLNLQDFDSKVLKVQDLAFKTLKFQISCRHDLEFLRSCNSSMASQLQQYSIPKFNFNSMKFNFNSMKFNFNSMKIQFQFNENSISIQ